MLAANRSQTPLSLPSGKGKSPPQEGMPSHGSPQPVTDGHNGTDAGPLASRREQLCDTIPITKAPVKSATRVSASSLGFFHGPILSSSLLFFCEYSSMTSLLKSPHLRLRVSGTQSKTFTNDDVSEFGKGEDSGERGGCRKPGLCHSRLLQPLSHHDELTGQRLAEKRPLSE